MPIAPSAKRTSTHVPAARRRASSSEIRRATIEAFCHARQAATRPNGQNAAPMTVLRYPDELREEVEAYLEQLRFPAPAAPRTAGLEEAMRYSLLAGGKRI